MQTLTIDHKNGHSTTYQLIKDSGNLPIAYHEETNKLVIDALEYARKNRIRVQLYFGDIETGADWHEEHDTTGYVSTSRGHEARFPILVYNSRSYGGCAILDHCIIKIRSTKGNVLYQSPNYQYPKIEVVPSADPKYKYETIVNGTLYGKHETLRQAENLKNKLS